MITLSFWGNLSSKEVYIDALYEALGIYITGKNIDGDIITFSLNDGSFLTLGTPENAKTKEKFQTQIDGLINFFNKLTTDKPKVRAGVIEQIALFNIMLGIAFEDTQDKQRLEHILASILLSAWKVNGVILLANMDLLDGKGNILLSHDGRSDYNEFTPNKFSKNIFNSDFKPSPEDETRYEKSNKLLEEKSILIPENTSDFIIKKAECEIRPIDEVAKRIFALLEICIYSECMLYDKLGKETAFKRLGDLNDKYKSTHYTTKRELEYLNTTDFSKEEGELFILRHEALLVLCWSLGFVFDLGEPNDICNWAGLVELIQSFETIEKLIIKSNFLDIDVLLQEHDKTMRQHLACINATKNDTILPFNIGVVSERHLALSWLLSAQIGNDWDNIEAVLSKI